MKLLLQFLSFITAFITVWLGVATMFQIVNPEKADFYSSGSVTVAVFITGLLLTLTSYSFHLFVSKKLNKYNSKPK